MIEETLGLRRNPTSTDPWIELETGSLTLVARRQEAR
jgi:hypothetical protein